ncbi:M6 family metalloprotease domain-containing protein [Gallaecimonas sp. GXIMD4217]|uniref:M6 family metalloprotease domain-containing protein n=1 Tax=Gallaecimonas sp. GXIMD4217 TaxID=3131927 RepID=UPI00311B03C3
MKNKITLALASAALSGQALAVSPAPVDHVLTQPDGTQIRARLKGGPFLNWYEDDQGHMLVREGDSWYYGNAEQSGDRWQIRSTGILADKDKPYPVLAAKAFAPGDEVNPHSLKHWSAAYPSHQPKALAAQAQVQQPLLTLLVSFDDVQIQHDFADLLWGQGKTLQDYYLQNSNNGYKVVPVAESEGTQNDGQVAVRLSRNHPNCGGDCPWDMDGVLAEALQAADGYVDFAAYDGNGDGWLAPDELSVQYIFAGNEAATGAEEQAVWGHRWGMTPVTLDGVKVADYCVFGELQWEQRASLGIIAHELGHLMLGLPDLYSYADVGQGIGDWGLMGGGSWGYVDGVDDQAGDTPAGMTAWSRAATEMVTPLVQSQDGSFSLSGLTPHQIYLDPYLRGQQLGESLLLSVRHDLSYDASLPGKGLLITHIDPQGDNSVIERKQVDIEAADGRTDLDTSANTGDAGDIWPGSTGATRFADDTGPNTRTNLGFVSGIQLANISSAASEMSYRLSGVATGKSALLKHGYHSDPIAEGDNSTSLLWQGLAVAADTLLEGVDFHAPAEGQLQLNVFAVNEANVRTGQVLTVPVLSQAQGWQRHLLAEPLALPARFELEVSHQVADGKAAFHVEPTGNTSDQFLVSGGAPSASRPVQLSLLLGKPGPQTRDDQYSLDEDGSLTLAPLANDDAGAERLTIFGQPGHGTLAQDGNSLIYTPDADFVGQDSFSYKAWSSDGAESRETLVRLTVAGKPDAPVARDTPTFYGQEATPLSLAWAELKAQVSDVDGEQFQWQQFHFGSHDGLSLSAGAEGLTITPSGNLAGDISLDYWVVDGDGLQSNVAKLKLHLESIDNDAPEVTLVGPASISAGQTLNLQAQASDPDGDKLSYQWRQLAGPGLVLGSGASQSLTLPSSGQRQEYRFEVTVTDPGGLSAKASLTVIQEPKDEGGGGGSLGWLWPLLLLLRRRR